MNELFRKSYPELQENFQIKNFKNKKIKIGFISEFLKTILFQNFLKA